MTGPAFSPIKVETDQLHILSGMFRLYVGLSRDGSYLHVIHPRGYEQRDIDGNLVGGPEDLVCGCKGFTFHGHCYRANQAIAFEQGNAVEAAWFGRPIAAETELEKAASRG